MSDIMAFVKVLRGYGIKSVPSCREVSPIRMSAKVKGWIGGLTEIGLMLLALAIVAALLVGSNLPFFGNVTGNIMALVKSLGDAGLVGLIALGVILWLFSSRRMA
jgi:hypothetical protein